MVTRTRNKYQDIVSEVKKLWNMKVTVILIVCLHIVKMFQVLLSNTNNAFDINYLFARCLMASSIAI